MKPDMIAVKIFCIYPNTQDFRIRLQQRVDLIAEYYREKNTSGKMEQRWRYVGTNRYLTDEERDMIIWRIQEKELVRDQIKFTLL